MQYAYTAKDKAGKVIKGTIEAANEKVVSSALREKELFPVNIKTTNKGIALFRHKINIKDKIVFTEQLHIMAKAGLPLSVALQSLRDETENKHFANQIGQIMNDVDGGLPLSEALAKHPNTFSDIYTNMVKSGEKTGKLDIVFDRLAKQLGKDYELNRKVRGALNYPIFIFFALIIVMAIILIYIIPQLKLIFDEADIKLPMITRAVIAISLFLKTKGIYLLASLLGFFALLARWKRTSSGKHFFDAIITRIPVIGLLLKKTYMSRFTRTFASLASSGLPLLDVFKVSGSVIGNVYYEEDVKKMATKVKNGVSVSKTLKESRLFPGIISQLAAVGEKSGSLDEVFDNLADFFDRDVDSITANLSVMLEPVMMVFMGIGIGIVIVSVLQPLYGLVNAI